MKITMTAIIKKQRAPLYTQKWENIAKRLYIQKTIHFSKGLTISVTFLYSKIHTLFDTGFHESFEVDIYIQRA